MGSRLYDEFMKKLKVPLVQRRETKQKDGKQGGNAGKDEIVICIPLKGGQGVSLVCNLMSIIASDGAGR